MRAHDWHVYSHSPSANIFQSNVVNGQSPNMAASSSGVTPHSPPSTTTWSHRRRYSCILTCSHVYRGRYSCIRTCSHVYRGGYSCIRTCSHVYRGRFSRSSNSYSRLLSPSVANRSFEWFSRSILQTSRALVKE